MSSILSSQSVALATAMVVSSTVLFYAFSRTYESGHLQKHGILRSCMCSDDKKKQKKRKNKRVKFADNVKDPSGTGEEYRRKHIKSSVGSKRNCSTQNQEMPANRVALYNGILRDRVHRMQCSY